jgi:hypothetical protein
MALPAVRADTDVAMNAYELLDGSGRNVEIEADFYQRAGDDLLFIAAGEEVLRIVAEDVQAIVRVPLRQHPSATDQPD